MLTDMKLGGVACSCGSPMWVSALVLRPAPTQQNLSMLVGGCVCVGGCRREDAGHRHAGANPQSQLHAVPAAAKQGCRSGSRNIRQG